jgi:hypothetical protein
MFFMTFMTHTRPTLRPVRWLLSVLVCTLLFLVNTIPAQAGNTPKSRPTEGTTQLNQILDKAEDAAKSAPMSLKEVEQRSKTGLNEVQGAADKDKMKSGDSTPPMVKKLERAMDKVTKD